MTTTTFFIAVRIGIMQFKWNDPEPFFILSAVGVWLIAAALLVVFTLATYSTWDAQEKYRANFEKALGKTIEPAYRNWRTDPAQIVFGVLTLVSLSAVWAWATHGKPMLDVPTDLAAERKTSVVWVTWRGDTVDYDFQQSFEDATRWHDNALEKLRPEQVQAGTAKYFNSVGALAQPMRFRVRAVEASNHSEWTEWVVSSP